MNLKGLIRSIVNETFYVNADGSIPGLKTPKERRFKNGTKTKTANELLKWVSRSPFSAAQAIADKNGDLRGAFDLANRQLKNRYAHLGSAAAAYKEDEESAFYDFAANYPRDHFYWSAMGRKILGSEIWDDHLNGKSSYHPRYAYIHVRDGYVEQVEGLIEKFGWWHHTFPRTDSLESTGMMIAPVPVKMAAY